MLAIRLQRTGRKGHAQFRLIVQEARLSPTSGKVVAALGNYDPHAKTVTFDKDKATFYLEHGAQPSDRVALLLKKEGVKLPKWVELADKKAGKIKNVEKLRRNRSADAEPKVEEPAEEPATEEAEAKAPAAAELSEPEAPVVAEAPAADAGSEPSETPAEEPAESADEEPAKEVADGSAEAEEGDKA